MNLAPNLLTAARADFVAGRLAHADTRARLHLRNQGPDPAASDLRNTIASTLGLKGWREQEMRPDVGKWLLIQACGAGFWSDLAHVLGGFLLAEITGRTAIVHWGANCRFRSPTLGDGDAFGRFFQTTSAVAPSLLETIDDRWPRNWPVQLPAQGAIPPEGCSPIELLARREALVIAPRFLTLPDLADWIPKNHPFIELTTTEIFRELMAKHLKAAPELQARADAFRLGPLHGAPYLSAHIRGTDKKLEVPNNESLITAYLLWADRMLGRCDLKLFLATDDLRFARILKDRYADRLVMAEAMRREDGVGVHSEPGESGYHLGAEMLIDTLIAAGGDHFVGNGSSNPSCAIALMRRQPVASCTLLTENYWLKEDMALLLL